MTEPGGLFESGGLGFSPKEPAKLPARPMADELRRDLDQARADKALYVERSQAQEEEIRRLRERLAKLEGEQRASEARSKQLEREQQDELEQAVQRERMLRVKFEEELRRVGRLRAAAEAEARESLMLKEKELASSLHLQEEMASRHQVERKKLEELVAGYRNELAKLRGVLQALEEKLGHEASERKLVANERHAMERLMTGLLQQNSKLSAALEENLKRRDAAEKELYAGLERGLPRPQAAPSPSPADAARLLELEGEKAALSAEAARLDEENDLLRKHLEAAEARAKDVEAAARKEQARFEAEEAGLNQRVGYLSEKLVDMQAQVEEELRSRKQHYEQMLDEVKGDLETKVEKAAGPAAPSPKAILGRLLKLLERVKKA